MVQEDGDSRQVLFGWRELDAVVDLLPQRQAVVLVLVGEGRAADAVEHEERRAVVQQVRERPRRLGGYAGQQPGHEADDGQVEQMRCVCAP